MDKIIIYDFGSQYTQLIARRIRELSVYCEIQPFNKQSTLDAETKACILAGSPFSVNDENAPDVDLSKFANVPVLGICYGAQLMAKKAGGKVQSSGHREYGKAALHVTSADQLFEEISDLDQVWMSHSDSIVALPEGFSCIASSNNIPVAAYKKDDTDVYGIQFHPEVTHTLLGKQLLANFLFKIAKCTPNWSPDAFVESQIAQLRDTIGQDEVLMGLSGGVDSTVAATLLHRAIGSQLHCFFIDNGLLRQDEFEQVLEGYSALGLNVTGVDAKSTFYAALKGISDPERKRKVIGHTFIEVFEKEAKNLPNVKWLGQGTIYPDVIESVSVHGPSVTIKSHHNVGGLPERLALKIIEPLRLLFKDEVRNVGRSLDLDDVFINRHPFPGPGLAIRILGDITEEKVDILQKADAIFINGLREFDLYDKVWQAATILLPVQSVGVMGDERTYEKVAVLRAVNSLDGMTAEWSKLPNEFLAEISSRIINQVNGINRVVYDISTKPPATIEWE